MMEHHSLKALPEHVGCRVDSFIAMCLDKVTRSAAQLLVENGSVLVNNKPAVKSTRLKLNDVVDVELSEPKEITASAEDISLDIVYEDECLVVVNKPKGMVVHPANGNLNGTLVNALLHHCKGELSGINGEIRPGIVHRIDKDTSGLLVVAKTNEAHLFLSEQLSNHTMTREYYAVAYGKFKQNEGFVDMPLGRSDKDRKKMSVVTKNGKTAYTGYKVLQRYNGFTLLSLVLKTGRTHQIRVHLSSIGHPLAGDIVYGPKKAIAALNGQCLHAKTLGFIHPVSKEYLEFCSELPDYFISFLQSLQKE